MSGKGSTPEKYGHEQTKKICSNIYHQLRTLVKQSQEHKTEIQKNQGRDKKK